MPEFCRLCAVSKQPDEFRCKIDDISFDIERKLVTCCNWNSYRSHENLPKGVCIPCFLQLEQCWYFRETVSKAQKKLCELMKVDLHPEPLSGNEEQLFEVKTEFYGDDTIETDPVAVSDLKMENDDDTYYYYDEDFDEDDLLVESLPNERPKVRKTASKTNPEKKKTNSKNKKSKPNNKKCTSNKNVFDIKRLLSHKDVNENGTIKPAKILEQNLCDWTVVKHRCYLCNADFNTHSDLCVHFTSIHPDERLKFICSICPGSIMFLSGHFYRKHIANTHHPHLAFCCHRCQKFFHDKKKMREHFRSHPKDPTVRKCATCGKGFSYYKNLHFHMLSHQSVELQFECHLCKKSLRSAQSLQKHIKCHVGIPKSAMCEQCGRTFVSAYRLREHMTKHTNDGAISHGSGSKSNRRSTKLSEDRRQNLKSAWNAVKEGRMTMYAAATEFNISYTTLWKWCRRTDIGESTPSVGRPCYLGMNLENKLKEWLLEAARTGFPVTPQSLKLEASKFNEEHGMVNGWQPGTKWYIGFVRRNPDISLRTPRRISSKKLSTTEPEVREWYRKVVELTTEKSWGDCLNNPNKIFNMEETSFCVNPNLKKVLARRGAKNVYNMSTNNEEDCLTVLLGGNAAGRQTPPLIIFQGKRLPNQTKQMLPKGWNANCSDSGWLNSETFYNYISKTFYPWLATEGISTPVILFVDGHISHRSLKLSEFCSEHQIILVSFLPNLTHICQPMDVLVHGPLKQKWASCLNEFRSSHQHLERMSKPLFFELLKKCVNETLTPESLQTSFVETSLHPFDADNFDYSKLSAPHPFERPSNNQAASSTAAYSDQSDENIGNEPNFTQEIRQMIADEDDRNVSFHRYLSL